MSYSAAPVGEADSKDATLYYMNKCNGKRKCKVNHKKDSKKLGVAKAIQPEIYLSYDCMNNQQLHKKKAIKQMRKSAVRTSTTEGWDCTFFGWYNGDTDCEDPVRFLQ